MKKKFAVKSGDLIAIAFVIATLGLVARYFYLVLV